MDKKEDGIKGLTNLLNDSILKEIANNLEKNENFLKNEVDTFLKIENEIDTTIIELAKRKRDWQTNVTELTKKAQHHTETKQKGEKYIES